MGLGAARSSSRVVSTVLRRRFTTTLEVTSKDAAYPWMLHWLKDVHGAAQPLRHVSVQTSLAAGAGNGAASFELVPAPGRHVLRYDGSFVLVERAREYSTVNTSSGTPWEKLTLTALATARTEDGALFASILNAARAAAEAAKDEDVTTLFTAWGTEWRPFGRPRRKRRLDSVVLGAGVAEAIVADVAEWRDSMEWYRSRGVPYRRGYLLHGPPGGGKTSFVLALAGHLGLDVCLLSLSDEGLTDDRLALSLAHVPANTLVLLEDVDAAFQRRDRARGHGSAGSSLTLSGLLNALDGAAASEGRVVFLTTNYMDHLDAALLRPGRVDVVHELGFATPDQAARLYATFYDQDEAAEDAVAFGRAAVAAAFAAADRPPSMAELQSYLLTRKHDRGAALRDAHELALVLTTRAANDRDGVVPAADPTDGESLRRRRQPLTALDVDRMVFNPQEGWEDSIGKIQ
mmetsp:Transcript_5696/g.20290  ORF Transcript_5696/g.20290 Transcript_5696/m.20290 type:complete len:460 (+) Transcript_5696:306-1685(+)